MNSAQRRKLTAGVGLIAMLLGALMVLAPTGAGADEHEGQNGAFAGECRQALGVPAGTFVYGGKWQWSGPSADPSGPDESLGGFTAQLGWAPIPDGEDDGTDPDGTAFSFSGASPGVYAIGVKQGQEPLDVGTFAGVASGNYDYTNDDGKNVFSHVILCGWDEPEDPPKLTVRKLVSTADEFEITVSQDEFSNTQDLANLEEIVVDPAEGTYDITEEALGAQWNAPVFACSDSEGTVSTTPITGGVSVEVVDDDVLCTVTNSLATIPPPPPPPPPTPTPEVEAASLQVVKAVAGAGAPDTWAVDFEVIGASVDEAFGVDNVISSRSFTDVEPGVYEITETLADGDAGVLTDVTCLDDGINEVLTDVTGDTATVVLADGDDVVCTFTNSYAAVLPDEVTTTTTTVVPATTAAPAPQVLGDVVTLPRTGNESRNLAGLGAVLLALGAAMVVGSNRRLVKQR